MELINITTSLGNVFKMTALMTIIHKRLECCIHGRTANGQSVQAAVSFVTLPRCPERLTTLVEFSDNSVDFQREVEQALYSAGVRKIYVGQPTRI